MNITFSSVQELKLKYRNMETIKIKQFDGSEKTVILPVRGMVGTYMLVLTDMLYVVMLFGATRK